MAEYFTSESGTFVMCAIIFLVGFVSCIKWLYKTSSMLTYNSLAKYLRGIYWVGKPKGIFRFKKITTAEDYDHMLNTIHQLDLKLVKEGELKGTAKTMHADLAKMLEDAPFEYKNGQVVAV